MSLDIFKIAGNVDFFNILASPSKMVNWMILYELYNEVMEIHERRISRSATRRIIEKLTTIYNKHNENKIGKDPASYISSFIESGWMEQRYDGEEGDDYLYFTQYALNFIRTVEYNENPVENVQVDDFLQRIHCIVKDILSKNVNSDAYKYPYRAGLMKINRLMGDCFYNLRTIEQQTSEDIKNILELQDLQTLINQLQEYIDDLNGGYLHDVYESFNMTSVLKRNMSELIDVITFNEEFRNKVITDMRERYKNLGETKDDAELSLILTDMVCSLETKINVTYPSYKNRIDKTIQNVIAKSLHKMNLLTESNASHLTVLSRVIDLMAYVAETNNEDRYTECERLMELLDGSVDLCKLGTVEENSLYKKREYTVKEEVQPVEVIEVTEDFDFGTFEIDRYSIKDANKYIRWGLRDKKEITAYDFELHEDTIPALQTIISQADNIDADYDVEFLGQKIIKDGYEFDDFKIIKK